MVPFKKISITAIVAVVLLFVCILVINRRRPLASNVSVTSQQPASIAETARKLQQASDRASAIGQIEELRHWLESLSAADAVNLITNYLASGADAPTHLGLVLRPDGSLSQAPTLRTLLLDRLAQIDATAAAAEAKKILERSQSPDEWAVALRGYALGNDTDEGREYLRQKARLLVLNGQWSKNPSTGFLESFDALVYTHDTGSTAALSNMTRNGDNPALAHAAYLTLDRLVQSDTASMLEQLENQPDILAGRETMRADFFARADVSSQDQRAILERYLLDPLRTGAELNQFASIFPNANYMVSYNLLTHSTTPTGEQLQARDRAALAAVEQWMGDPRFAGLQPQLQKIRARLQQFAAQAH